MSRSRNARKQRDAEIERIAETVTIVFEACVGSVDGKHSVEILGVVVEKGERYPIMRTGKCRACGARFTITLGVTPGPSVTRAERREP